MRKVYILPNLFTAASLLCGLLSITHIFRGDYEVACYLILISALLDGLDGKIAYLTRTQSAFGLHFDSLADLVAFGVAPAMLIYSWMQAITTIGTGKVATGVASLFVICGALRLARFNVQALREEKRNFTGLPIPAAAGAVVSTFLALLRTNLWREEGGAVLLKILPLIFVGLSCLMVSNIPYPSLKNIDLRQRKPFDYLVLIVVIVCFMVGLWQMQTLILFLGFWGYVAWGLAGRFLRAHKPQQNPIPGITLHK